MTEETKETETVQFCPFSKAPCGKNLCALWSFKIDGAGGSYDCALVVMAETLSRIEAHGIDTTNHY